MYGIYYSYITIHRFNVLSVVPNYLTIILVGHRTFEFFHFEKHMIFHMLLWYKNIHRLKIGIMKYIDFAIFFYLILVIILRGSSDLIMYVGTVLFMTFRIMIGFNLVVAVPSMNSSISFKVSMFT